MLYIIFPGLIYFITESLYFWLPLPILTTLTPASGNYHMFFVSMSSGIFKRFHIISEIIWHLSFSVWLTFPLWKSSAYIYAPVLLTNLWSRTRLLTLCYFRSYVQLDKTVWIVSLEYGNWLGQRHLILSLHFTFILALCVIIDKISLWAQHCHL